MNLYQDSGEPFYAPPMSKSWNYGFYQSDPMTILSRWRRYCIYPNWDQDCNPPC